MISANRNTWNINAITVDIYCTSNVHVNFVSIHTNHMQINYCLVSPSLYLYLHLINFQYIKYINFIQVLTCYENHQHSLPVCCMFYAFKMSLQSFHGLCVVMLLLLLLFLLVCLLFYLNNCIFWALHWFNSANIFHPHPPISKFFQHETVYFETRSIVCSTHSLYIYCKNIIFWVHFDCPRAPSILFWEKKCTPTFSLSPLFSCFKSLILK